MDIKRFIDQEKPENKMLQYSAGIVLKEGNRFIVALSQYGAKETFSIGQPIFDKEGNTLGYLGIGLYENLDYAFEGRLNDYKGRIPVECWEIFLPTRYCKNGEKIFTFWQKEEKENDCQKD